MDSRHSVDLDTDSYHQATDSIALDNLTQHNVITRQSPLLSDFAALDFVSVDDAIGSLPAECVEVEEAARTTLWSKFRRKFNPVIQWFDPLTQWFSDRDRMLLLRLAVALSVSIANLVWTAYAAGTYPAVADGYHMRVIYQGSCSTTKSLAIWLHLLINILSTLLLSSSSSCMQVLCAPTREDVDDAHAAGKWLDIGVVSFRNLRSIYWKRSVAWIMLALCSTSLHLVWNSSMFVAKPITAYAVAVSTPDFFSNRRPWDISDGGFAHGGDRGIADGLEGLQERGLGFEKLNTSACLHRYLDMFSPGKDLIVITSLTNHTLNNGSTCLEAWMHGGKFPSSQAWLCRHYEARGWNKTDALLRFCSIETMAPFLDNWILRGNPWGSSKVQYCLSEGVQNFKNMCGFYFSTPLAALVCLCTLLQSSFIFYTTSRHRNPSEDTEPLVILGDAIKSFQRSPNEHTKELGMLSYADISNTRQWRNTATAKSRNPWRPPREIFWYQAAGMLSWVGLMVLCFTCILLTGVGLSIAVNSIKKTLIPIDAKSIGRFGLGQTYAFSIVQNIGGSTSNTTLLQSVLLANCCQVVVNVIYQFLRNYISTMLIVREWNSYACRTTTKACLISPPWWRRLAVALKLANPAGKQVRAKASSSPSAVPAVSNLTPAKALRVSSKEPNSRQRPSYFLSMPYRYAIPLNTSLAVLQFFISQSLYLVQATSFNANGSRNYHNDSTRVGYSLLGIILSLFLGRSTVVAVAILSLRKYPGAPANIPLVSTCSVAISAACHPPQGDDNSYRVPLRYGMTSLRDGVGHCCFTTARDVRPAVPGIPYA